MENLNEGELVQKFLDRPSQWGMKEYTSSLGPDGWPMSESVRPVSDATFVWDSPETRNRFRHFMHHWALGYPNWNNKDWDTIQNELSAIMSANGVVNQNIKPFGETIWVEGEWDTHKFRGTLTPLGFWMLLTNKPNDENV